jgi:plastocyanin
MSPFSTYRGRLTTLLALAASALLVLSFACGGDDDGATTAATTPAGTGNGGGGGETTVDVSMTDEKYIPSDFTVGAGDTLILNLTNDGTAIHNVRIAGVDGEYNTDDDAVSDPDLISAGDTGTVTWEAPNEAGEYEYKCDIHPNLGGTITVE